MGGVGVSPTRPTTLTGTDGVVRCGWVTAVGADLTEYHDREWGTPVHDEAALFEALVSTYFENGLSWAIVINKRAALRRAFADFKPSAVAKISDRDVDLLM
ncbi:MAG TPA: DNA-3-methyladenine glycosylase I, partial [Mycobacterium sp.]